MKPSVLLHREWRKHVAKLTQQQKGDLLDAIFNYDGTDSAAPSDPVVDMAFSFMRSAFDADEAKYNAKIASNQNNGKKGGRPEHNPNNPDGYSDNPNNPVGYLETERLKKKPKKADTDTVSDTDTDTVSDTDTGSLTGGTAQQRFVPPTLAEVAAYVLERHSPVIPQKFIDFYEAKGWKVGKTPMKDWKAACRNAEDWDKWAKKSGADREPTAQQMARRMDDIAQMRRMLGRGEP